MIVSFNASWLARAWLAVGVASVADKLYPMLDRTLRIELYADGARLVATDRLLLLHAWVPAMGKEDDPPPGLDDAPAETVTVYDTHGRAAGLFAHLLALTKPDPDGVEPPDIEVTIGVGDDGGDSEAFAGLLSFAGLEARQVSVMATGRELLMLDTYEGDWPNWRSLTLRHVPRRTSSVALPLDVLGRLARLGKLYDGPLVWTFGGVNKLVALAIGGDPMVEGVVLPDRRADIEGDD